jgi:hypothetical protein
MKSRREGGRDLMARRKISAKEAVADIRSGVGDRALMKKYGLSPDGLQSLFDKLVSTGFIDLGEMRNRLTGFLGSVVIPEAYLFAQKGQLNDQPLKSNPTRTINAQEGARDIRLGMDDSALAEKYRLTPKGLTSLFHKLMTLGLLTQKDLDRRLLGSEDATVDLREDKLSLSDALKHLGIESSGSSGVKIKSEPEPPTVEPVAKASTEEEMISSVEKAAVTFDQAKRYVGPFEDTWYDKPALLILLLLGVFPLGLYGLYRTRRLSTGTKAFMIVGWFTIAAVWTLVLYRNI